MRKKKPVITLEEYLENDKKSQHAAKFKNALSSAKGSDEDENLINALQLKTGKYSLRTWIKNNPWLTSGRPASSATKWLFQEVLKDPSTYRYRKLFMEQGGLFLFDYLNPKYKDTKQLPWFDKYPLVLSLGPVVTKLGIRNLGFNLHLLPPKIRIIVICQVFEIYKQLYRFQIFYKQDKPVTIKYQLIVQSLKAYGVDFSIRMYIPKRQKTLIKFPYRDWYRAIFIPSRGYDGIQAQKLITEWRKHVRKTGYATSPNTQWQSKV